MGGGISVLPITAKSEDAPFSDGSPSKSETKTGPMVVALLQVPVGGGPFLVFLEGQKCWVESDIFSEPVDVGPGSVHGGVGYAF
jgi:hypothetical protein